jgi:RNA polymerase sigma factor (sigma-70 family)
MTSTMNPPHGSSLETRPSLLSRLKAGDDRQSWQDFYKTYGGLIRFFAEKAGLTADEAEEVVQETAIGVARQLPDFVYDPKVCRFKTWLLNMVRWRIQDQIRKRARIRGVGGSTLAMGGETRAPSSDDTASTAEIDRIADPNAPEFGAEWDSAWEKNLLKQALERVRARIDERKFQIFDFCVIKGWPPKDVAQTLGITVARVYLTKHRVSVFLKRELRKLEKATIRFRQSEDKRDISKAI